MRPVLGAVLWKGDVRAATVVRLALTYGKTRCSSRMTRDHSEVCMMAVLRATDAMAVLAVAANKGATARLLAACDPRRVLYPLLTVRAGLDGGHRCVRCDVCPVAGP